ncbi:histone-lysine N-methyltransferase NSD3 isoform X2 [Ictalurus punctatus]|uniref:Histone-lysine N-methyltransferase NSD3 isoform X2 n=1 Tax=Ictalurus punctatus TaxID=7998 RepID=A0A9F7TLH1_ICTPU|nr:histone-lysine N-methyltransferase NSD3 isoform X2 [Ictalurus punctatus]
MRRVELGELASHPEFIRDKAGLDVKYIDAFKGTGVFTMTHFTKGEFINSLESNRRHRIYHNNLKGFMFDFIKFWTIDAARDDGTLGRLVNDDHINPNCKMKRIIVKGKPHLCLFALRDITPGEEVTYNYGDADCPWRSKCTKCGMDANTNRLESGATSGDVTQCTQHSQHKSASHIEVTESVIEVDSNRLESDGASGDDHHCTQHSQDESTFCNLVTESGIEVDSNRLESDGASRDDHHCTQHSQHESSFCNLVWNCLFNIFYNIVNVKSPQCTLYYTSVFKDTASPHCLLT